MSLVCPFVCEGGRNSLLRPCYYTNIFTLRNILTDTQRSHSRSSIGGSGTELRVPLEASGNTQFFFFLSYLQPSAIQPSAQLGTQFPNALLKSHSPLVLKLGCTIGFKKSQSSAHSHVGQRGKQPPPHPDQSVGSSIRWAGGMLPEV